MALRLRLIYCEVCATQPVLSVLSGNSMKHPVSDSAVSEYAKRLRAGGPLGTVFPAKLSQCAFTDVQREVIRQARSDKRNLLKSSKQQASRTDRPLLQVLPLLPKTDAKVQKPRPMTKLRRALYLQSGRCFFCGEALQEEDANIEHLNPQSRGGTRTEDNEVACHKTLNETFGDLDLKQKFAFVLKSAGSFRCPNT